MALPMEKLYKNCMTRYRMKLIAGNEGMDNLVKWVHIVEDEEVPAFLHGGELVFTAGIRSQISPDWLRTFVENLHQAGASAFVVNIGPYIQVVPEDVIAYCNEISMPLFTIPWETHMVDMTREFCQRIIRSETIEDSISTTIKNILFQIGDLETQILQMERYGYRRESSFCFVSITIEETDFSCRTQMMERLERCAEEKAKSISELFIHFIYKESLILVLVEYTLEEIEQFIQEYKKIIQFGNFKTRIFLGISSNVQGMTEQAKNFENALAANRMAVKQGVTVMYYDQLGFYKILLQVNDQKVIREYYQEMLGKVEQYDLENETNLMEFLRSYLENNGSPGQVAQKQYIHRNTVNNMLKKVEKITGYNMLGMEGKMRCAIGFYIRDLL